jgi:hypothetical protein
MRHSFKVIFAPFAPLREESGTLAHSRHFSYSAYSAIPAVKYSCEKKLDFLRSFV